MATMPHLIVLIIVMISYMHAVDISMAPVFVNHDSSPGNGGCVDLDKRCAAWASQNECQRNAAWMMGSCRRSCKSCQGGDRAWQLRARIAEGYDNTTHLNNFTTAHVLIDSASIDHLEVDESRQLVQMHGKIVMTWNDTRIAWDNKQWGINWLNFYWIQVWTPDIVQTNSPSAMPGRFERTILAANYTGQIFMWADFSFTVPCTFDHGSYPHDVQRCCANIDDQRYFAVRFGVSEQAKKTLRESIKKTHSPQWQLEDADIKSEKYSVKMLTDWHKDPYALSTTNCDLCVSLRRKAAFYSSEIVAPAIATSLITIISFIMRNSAHQTLLLLSSIALQIGSFALAALKVPGATDSPPPIYAYFSFNMGMTLLAFVLTTILSHVATYRTQVPPPHLVDTVIGLLTKVMPCCCIAEDSESTDSIDEAGNSSALHSGKMYWAPFARCVRLLLLLAMLVLYFLMCVACFVF